LPVPVVTPEQAAPTVAPLAGPLNKETWEERPLYGGALTACIPRRFNDCRSVAARFARLALVTTLRV
jgi:hypothetical protein